MASLRKHWLTAHRWFALSLGWVLVLMGITGALLVISTSIDKRLHTALYTVQARAAAPTVSLESIRRDISAGFAMPVTLSLRPPRATGESLRVMVNGAWSGTIYVDPFTGDELGRRGQMEGFFNLLLRLHSSLWLGSTGKALLAFVSLAYLLLLISGLVLWWPRSGKPSWRVTLGKGQSRALYDLHRVGGASIGLLIGVSVATGAYMAWRPLGGIVNAFSHVRAVSVPALPPTSRSPLPLLPLDVLVSQARAQFPDGMVGLIQMPAKPGLPLRVRLKLPDDPHPNGLSSVWVDPFTAKVMLALRWDRLDPGARAVSIIFPLHTGELGGPWLECILALGGVSLAGIAVTGIWQWWRRRNRRRTTA